MASPGLVSPERRRIRIVPVKNPWKTCAVRDVYDNAWIRVTEHQVINPSGGKGLYGVVGFKNLAIGIVPLDEHDNTWLVGQYRYTLDAYSWEIPMGGSPVDTDPLAGAKRELREETGLSAERWTEIMRLHTSNCVTDELGIVYIARGLSLGNPQFDETELLDIRKIGMKEAVAMVMNGEITDALSVAGLLKAEYLRLGGGLP